MGAEPRRRYLNLTYKNEKNSHDFIYCVIFYELKFLHKKKKTQLFIKKKFNILLVC